MLILTSLTVIEQKNVCYLSNHNPPQPVNQQIQNPVNPSYQQPIHQEFQQTATIHQPNQLFNQPTQPIHQSIQGPFSSHPQSYQTSTRPPLGNPYQQQPSPTAYQQPRVSTYDSSPGLKFSNDTSILTMICVLIGYPQINKNSAPVLREENLENHIIPISAINPYSNK